MVVLLGPERHRVEITELLSKVLRRPVVIGPLSMGYFPPTLRLSQVSVMKEGGTAFLEIESASAPLDLAGLLHLQFVPRALQFSRWKLMISRKADGSWDISDWLTGASSGTGGRPTPAVSVTSGEVHWVDSFANPSQELVLSSVSGSWDPPKNALAASGDFAGIGSPAHMTFAAGGQFLQAPQWSGDVQLTDRHDTCVIHLDNKAGTWDVKGTAVQWPVGSAVALVKFYARAQATGTDVAKGLELRQWQFHIGGNASHLSFDHSAGISSGLSEAKGTLETSPKGIITHLQAAGKEIPAEVLQAVAGEDISLSGQATGVLQDLQLTFSSGTLMLENGQGYCEVKNGRYKIPAGSIQRLTRAKTMAYFKKKFPDLDMNGIPVARLSAHWHVKEGLIVTEDGLLVSNDFKAGWMAKIDTMRKGIDATIRLDIHEKDANLAGLIPYRYRTQPAFGRLQGTWKEWLLRSLSSGKVPGSVQAKLRKAVKP